MTANLKQAALDLIKAVEDFGEVWAMLDPTRVDALYDAMGNARRVLFEMRINELAEHGEVAVVESGRDCDCVEYHGKVSIIQATIDAYEAHYDQVNEWADGPFRLDVRRPSEAESIRYSSRDLVLEAHEDGHPHHIVSQFG